MPVQELYLIRHGETEWSLNGRHTGTTDIPLTENGRRVAKLLAAALAKEKFALVLTSPLKRARETCELAGFGGRAEIDRDLMEWNYGAYGGETPEQVGTRVDQVIAKVRAVEGDAALFAHGHLFRVFAARWLALPAAAGSHFLLDTATLNILSYYRGTPAVKRWNAPLGDSL